MKTITGLAVALVGALAFTATKVHADALPSWNDSKAKRSIVDFVAKVTKDGSPDFVPVAERIATFDNDGTLWAEQPLYFQLVFALARVKALAPQHPEWKDKEPFASLLRDDLKGALAGGEPAIFQIVMATHTGMTTEEFETTVVDWIATAKHPKTKRPYTEMVYQPMLELLAYLRANGFKTFIVSGGGIDFMRPWAEKVYGIPPEQVIGSSGKLKFELRDGSARAREAARTQFHRRQGRQASRHPAAHRPPADRRFRQFRRRPADAAIDRGRSGPAVDADRSSRRRRARIRLRPGVAHWQARQGLGRGEGEGLDRRQHEKRLEQDFRV